MLEMQNEPEPLHPLLVAILILLTMGVGFIVIGPIIGFLIAMPFYDGSIQEMGVAIQAPLDHPEIKTTFYLMQGAATVIGLIMAPLLLVRVLRRSVAAIFRAHTWIPLSILMTPIIVIAFMGVNSLFIEWNTAFHFPEFLKGFETWAREKEDYATLLTKFMTEFNSVGEFVLAFIVIAMLPAIGEELVFRGLLQSELNKATKNIHVAIWISAILFSAIHMQFFGFVPRLLLGALFGYLYYWSGNIWISILAHFVNNGFAVVAMYLYQQGKLDFDMDSTESVPLPAVLLSVAVTFALLYYFRKFFKDQASIES